MATTAKAQESTAHSAGQSRRAMARSQQQGVRIAGAEVPLPSTEDMVYYGGLGVLTAMQMIEWPVTLAVGAGYALASRQHHGNGRA